MEKNFMLTTVMVLFILAFGFSQQTPVFSDYYYNTITINPAHAGFYKNTDITLSNAGYVNQIEGAPRNLSLAVNMPLNSEHMGLGAGVISDQIGVTSTTQVFASYSYKIIFDHHYNRGYWWEHNPNVISFGITGGFLLHNENLVSLGIQNDPNFENNINTSIPVLGVGFLYNKSKVYAGVSLNNILGDSLSSEENINLESPLYIYGGYRLFTTRFHEVMITPNALLKYTSGAPLQIDMNVSLNYKNYFELGAGYRTSSSMNFFTGFYALKHLRILFNYTASFRNSPVNNAIGVSMSYRFGNGFQFI